MVERIKSTASPPHDDWAPSAPVEVLRRRAQVFAAIRHFFAERNVLEVDTPVLSHAAVTDPNLESLSTRYTGPGAAAGTTLYLHTSPEFAMKRLLAAGLGSIYQICHVFRNAERGRLHNPEFTMLEFYRLDSDHRALMQETLALLTQLLAPYRPLGEPEMRSYAEVFQTYAHLDDVHGAGIEQLRAAATALALDAAVIAHADSVNVLRDLILTHAVEPHLGAGRLTAVYDYPVSQAALARIRAGHPPVAERFEIYLDGIELANGFHELANAQEQRRRFEHDVARRRAGNRTVPPIDQRLLAALQAGLPDCAGVAVGLDRVIMLAAGDTELARALPFPFERA